MRTRLLQFLLLIVLAVAVSCTDHKAVPKTPAPLAAKTSTSLEGTDWMLTDLAGTPVIANSKASLSFLDAGRAAGNGSCNRFTDSVTISGDAIKFGPMASTRMACIDGGASAQEDQYLKILGTAKRFEEKDGELLIYSEGYYQPLRFSRQTTPKP